MSNVSSPLVTSRACTGPGGTLKETDPSRTQPHKHMTVISSLQHQRCKKATIKTESWQSATTQMHLPIDPIADKMKPEMP
eukprot:scaffold3004_cov17-Prasinocladus_malaysianus.AAC.1